MPAGVRFGRLDEWLDWQQRLHPSTIDLGLDRVRRVLARTGWRPPSVPVITVGGTNGKGSCVALCDAILRASGRRVGTFTSPHLVDYRERIRVQGECVPERTLVATFERIADALGGDSLTFFEFNALAALLVFETAGLDAWILEVGLGGRLDAVNVVDPDVAVVVSVGLDHTDWLGPDVESIGREKAGIFRAGRPAVFGAPLPPASIRAVAQDLGATLYVRGEAFDGVVVDAQHWDFRLGDDVRWAGLPLPALAGSMQVANAATALRALACVEDRLPLERTAIEDGLRRVRLPGRFQRVPDPRGFEWVFDVAHNPAAAATLARTLAERPVGGRTFAVCGMLGDKDVAGVVAALRGSFDRWFAADAEGPRALTGADLAQRALAADVQARPAGTVPEAMGRAADEAVPGDRIVVFGSFHTVGPALASLGVHL